jgi:hypothetical protein
LKYRIARARSNYVKEAKNPYGTKRKKGEGKGNDEAEEK